VSVRASSLDEIPALAQDLLSHRHFVRKVRLTCASCRAERTRWEVFQGRLLDPAHTRQERTFASWDLHQVIDDTPSPEPLLSLKLDGERGELHVVRGVEGYVHEGYDSGGGVYVTRERRRWVRELVATFDLGGVEDLRGEVAAALARAVTGTRLPLTPVEAPLPAFSFGQLWYRHDEAEPGRELEFDLRCRPAEAVSFTWSRRSAPEVLAALRQMFLGVSLSPYTDFTDRVLRFLVLLEQEGRLRAEEVLDFEGWLLRLVARHLTAYDLVTFHHRGANYPDALLLDAVLGDFLARLERAPGLFADDRLRRRALRQAVLVRQRYEGHPVPDVPTSPGEHARVYPDGYPRVPEEQFLQTATRRRLLFAGDPLAARLTPAAKAALARSVADLEHEAERVELGAAVFLDRPFAAGGPVAPDSTPLLASLAYSRSIAAGRLRQLGGDAARWEGQLAMPGLPLDRVGPPPRQATVSLADAGRAASDFVFRHTLPGGVRAVAELFDFGPFADRLSGRILLARSPRGPGLVVYDEGWRPRMEFEPCVEGGHLSRRGVEVPAGLRITHVDGEALPRPVAMVVTWQM
jgi:hypothetical protein